MFKKRCSGYHGERIVTGIKGWYLIIAFYISNNEKDVE
jgi:hypothetical protein